MSKYPNRKYIRQPVIAIPNTEATHTLYAGTLGTLEPEGHAFACDLALCYLRGSLVLSSFLSGMSQTGPVEEVLVSYRTAAGLGKQL